MGARVALCSQVPTGKVERSTDSLGPDYAIPSFCHLQHFRPFTHFRPWACMMEHTRAPQAMERATRGNTRTLGGPMHGWMLLFFFFFCPPLRPHRSPRGTASHRRLTLTCAMEQQLWILTHITLKQRRNTRDIHRAPYIQPFCPEYRYGTASLSIATVCEYHLPVYNVVTTNTPYRYSTEDRTYLDAAKAMPFPFPSRASLQYIFRRGIPSNLIPAGNRG